MSSITVICRSNPGMSGLADVVGVITGRVDGGVSEAGFPGKSMERASLPNRKDLKGAKSFTEHCDASRQSFFCSKQGFGGKTIGKVVHAVRL